MHTQPHHPTLESWPSPETPSLPCILTQAGFAIRVHDVLGVASTNRPVVGIVTRVLAAPIAVVARHWEENTVTRVGALETGSLELPMLTLTPRKRLAMEKAFKVKQ